MIRGLRDLDLEMGHGSSMSASACCATAKVERVLATGGGAALLISSTVKDLFIHA